MADWHWRNTMRPVRFFALDARAAFPFLILLVHARLWTLGLAIVVTTFFFVMERRGLTYEAGIRSIRSWVAGRYRTASLAVLRRRMKDMQAAP
ncbi:MAG: IcmT/TraK family protein [Pseudomonadota bacterium]|nr:IcmT/TraK family protein [Pseudomonadota bacterium]